MKTLIKFLFAFLSCQVLVFSQAQHQGSSPEDIVYRYPIFEDGKWGFIDEKGIVQIAPQFYTYQVFSEGLAAVRPAGKYGYIDPAGKQMIPFVFDYAEAFKRGIARVYKNDKPYYINKRGKILFEHDFAEIGSFNELKAAKVISKGGKYGLIEQSGKLIIDTLYSSIGALRDERYVVWRKVQFQVPNSESMKSREEVAVFDLNGNIVVPFGTYQSIRAYSSGVAEVKYSFDFAEENGYRKSFIDRDGKILFHLPTRMDLLYYDEIMFHEGLLVLEMHDEGIDLDTISDWRKKEASKYYGVLDQKGNLLFSDPQWKNMTPFKFGRAFVKNEQKEWFLINKQGEILHEQPIIKLAYDTQYGNYQDLLREAKALVKLEDGWTIIDTNGTFLTEPISLAGTKLVRQASFVRLYKTENKKTSYGYWNLESGQLVPPSFQKLSIPKNQDKLIYVHSNNVNQYITRQNEVVWEESPQRTSIGFNIDYLNRGYYYASSPYMESTAGLGGWGQSDNQYSKKKRKLNAPQNEFKIIIEQEQGGTLPNGLEMMKLYISNNTGDTLFFNAQDSRLYLKIQALNPDGQWRDIEYLPSSWCGNSYHKVFLPPQSYWDFTIPKYEGEFKTQLRAQLQYLPSLKAEEQILYSDPFEGSVNPGQFWRQPDYVNRGLMDPYDN